MLWKNQHLIGLQLGEGGYSFVYLAREIEEDSARAQPQQFALKKVSRSGSPKPCRQAFRHAAQHEPQGCLQGAVL